MDEKFLKMHKIFSNIDRGNIPGFVNQDGKNINNVSIFNEDGSFNENLKNKDDFVKLVFGGVHKNINMYNDFFDSLANMDNNPEMSEEEIKFLASFDKEQNSTVIDKNDFYELGLIGRNIKKYIETNNSDITREILLEPEINITSPNKVPDFEQVIKVNDELEINGKIDEPVIQGNVGDCWLLAGINGLNATDKGKEIIKNSIVPNDDGSITIKFRGVGKDITLTADEIKEHDTDTNFQDNYSNGDNDALVLEMGMQKLIEQNPDMLMGLDKGINGGQTFNFWKALIPNSNIVFIQDKFEEINKTTTNERGTISAQNGVSTIFKEKIKEILQESINNKNIVMGFANTMHAMAITDVKDNEVTYLDSMNYGTKTQSWNDFIKEIKSFTYIDLSNM